jgi:hypothetical protein
MSNTLSLLLIALVIGLIIGLVVFVQLMVNNRPDTKVGQISKKIDDFIDRLPDD